MIIPIIYIVTAFIVLWLSSGVTVSAVSNLSRRIRISSFLISFFALGFMTSMGEMSVAFFSLIDKTPGISVGNLLGASTVLTLLVIPLYVISSKQVPLYGKNDEINLPAAYLVIALPAILLLDNRYGRTDAALMLFSYLYLVMTISNRESLLERLEDNFSHPHVQTIREFFKLIFSAALIIISSKIIVDNFVYLSNIMHFSPYIVGLVILSLGTNIPEISVLIRSHISKKKDVALGDYVGSAALNTVILSLLVLGNGGEVVITQGVKLNILLLPLGALLFLIFARNKKFERAEAFILLAMYVAFVVLEFVL